eukprot:TRINITY_DN16413_c0_g1_i1.p1 TRINITY_DN16413_c0_g1~~TRINITY_DN16413_c0_g1_i1.p1  ORF type:complete len:355 (-),score=102.88 TRINITY_DN16413_c0_g1_i1:186-1199(-)
MYMKYPRWEMMLVDVFFSGLDYYFDLQCLWMKKAPCTPSESMLLTRRGRTFDLPLLDPALWHTQRIHIPTRDQQTIPLYVAIPRDAPEDSPLPVLLEFHGGGHYTGVETTVWVAQALERSSSKFVLFSPGYRKAPEYPFPYAPRDGLDALRWVRTHAAHYNGNPQQLWLAGTSAGGNLAAAVSHAALGDPDQYGAIRGQILFSPTIDFHFSTASFAQFWDTPVWSAQKALIARSYYLPDPLEWVDPLASPWYSLHWEGLGKSLLVVDRFDPLRDDGVRYREKLVENGNEVVFVELPSYHVGAVFCGGAGVGYQEEYEELVEVLAQFFDGGLEMEERM